MKHIFLNHSPNSISSWDEAFPSAKKEMARGEFGTLKDNSNTTVWLRISYTDGAEHVSQLVQKVQRHLPASRLVILSDVPNSPQAADLFGLGVSGYCNSRAAPEVLVQVASTVEKNGLWMGPDIMQHLIQAISKAKTDKKEANNAQEELCSLLSKREMSVATLVAQGNSNKEVARQLKIGVRTVKAHLSSIFEKTGLRDRLQLSLKINGLSESN